MKTIYMVKNGVVVWRYIAASSRYIYSWPKSTRPMGWPKARQFGPTRARAQHGFSSLGRHEHDIRLCWTATSAHSVGPARHEIAWHNAAHVPARGPVTHFAQPARHIFPKEAKPATASKPSPATSAVASWLCKPVRPPQKS
jgi:hypothetical protein